METKGKNEVWVFNYEKGKLPNMDGKLKTMRFGKQALDIRGKKLSPDYMLPVFIKRSELDLLNELWNKEIQMISGRY